MKAETFEVKFEVKVVETGAGQTFDTMEEVADWVRLVRKTFGCWDSSVTFDVVRVTVTRSKVKCDL